MVSRKVLDKMYEELYSAKAVTAALQGETAFPDQPGVIDVHRERIRSALDRVATIDLFIDLYLSDQ